MILEGVAADPDAFDNPLRPGRPLQTEIIWTGVLHNTAAVVMVVGILYSYWQLRTIIRLFWTRRGCGKLHLCPRCRYSLVGLPDGAVCPECGSAADGTRPERKAA